MSNTSSVDGPERKRVPPGQVVTQGWPVLHAGSVPNISLDNWSLRVHGEVKNELLLNYEELLKLGHTVQTNDIHCVTSWSRLDVIWEGIRFKDLMKIVEPTDRAHFVIFEAEQGFTTNLPLEVVMDDDVLIAFKASGRPLEAEHGGPVRMLVPKRYFYKSAKWLKGIKLSEYDEPGFWEIRGYSNSANPWKQERYAGLSYAEIVKNRLKAYGRKK
ncbi:MAG: molybdopterin-dependent oxidoreductase [archaeon]|nr:molybdopterin-dependent oxidoreductase [archaeon]